MKIYILKGLCMCVCVLFPTFILVKDSVFCCVLLYVVLVILINQVKVNKNDN